MTKEEFKQARKMLFFSQEALADEWGISSRSVRRWEDGTTPISPLAVYAMDLMIKKAGI